MILVTAKVNPDLDGTSCTLAYAELLNQLGQEADGEIFGSVQSEVKYFIDKQNVSIPFSLPPSGQTKTWQKFVLVDASSMKGMPAVVRASDVIEIIDHRASSPETEFPNARIQNEPIGAAATIIVERFIKAEKKLTLEQAKLLYGAIYHNTLNFISSNTTQRDKEAALFLEKTFSLSRKMIEEMFTFSTKEALNDLEAAILLDAKEFESFENHIGAYQLIVFGGNLQEQKEALAKAVQTADQKYKPDWSFLNVVDLKDKISLLLVKGEEGEKILGKALGVTFKNGWVRLDKPILRKQIMAAVS